MHIFIAKCLEDINFLYPHANLEKGLIKPLKWVGGGEEVTRKSGGRGMRTYETRDAAKIA